MENKTANFEDTKAWKDAVELSVLIYRLTANFPKDEVYGLTSQIRRAVNSISANIAEGYGRYGKKEKHQFYVIAYGSLLETKSFLLLSVRLGYIDNVSNELDMIELLQKQINAIKRLLR